MVNELKQKLETLLMDEYHCNIKLEEPKDRTLGDIAIPLFILGRELNKKLPTIFNELRELITKSKLDVNISLIEFKNGYLNIKLNQANVIQDIIQNTLDIMENGAFEKNEQTAVFDYSSPNIAKSFSVGHLRSTIIGNALANIYKKVGYNVVRVNHIGDWGTQFGKMIVAYQKWGNKGEIQKEPIQELSRLYIQFHNEAKQNPTLEDEAREAFVALENGEEPYVSIWKWFKEESLKEFKMMYDLLGVSFDSFNGEAFYNDQLDHVVQMLEENKLLTYDDGAYIVDLTEDDMPPALIKKRDGASLYITRDLAAVLYRKKVYNFNEVLYVVGNEQSLHFDQVKTVVKKMGYKDYENLKHVNFGLVLKDGKKMSTRKGNVAKLYDVLTEAINQAKETIIKKKSNIKQINDQAKAIGVSAIIYNDLKNDRTRNIDFNLKNMLNFDGMTGPYIQYTRVRMHSILNKSSQTVDYFNSETLKQSIYYDLIYLVGQYKKQLEKAKQQAEPSIIARYAYQIAKEFNKVYASDQFIVENKDEMNTKMTIIKCTQFILDECMDILGMTILDQM